MVRATSGPALWMQVPRGVGRGALALEALVTPKGAAATRRFPLCAGGPSLVISTPCPRQGELGLSPLQVPFSSLSPCLPPHPRALALGWPQNASAPSYYLLESPAEARRQVPPRHGSSLSGLAARNLPPARPHFLLPSCPFLLYLGKLCCNKS